MEESTISIINKNNGQLTGEKANAVPIRLISNLRWMHYLLLGIFVSMIIAIAFISTIQKRVVAVEVSGRTDEFRIFEVK